jgi:hypothetical protein
MPDTCHASGKRVGGEKYFSKSMSPKAKSECIYKQEQFFGRIKAGSKAEGRLPPEQA